jgi:hypothetical protein
MTEWGHPQFQHRPPNWVVFLLLTLAVIGLVFLVE